MVRAVVSGVNGGGELWSASGFSDSGVYSGEVIVLRVVVLAVLGGVGGGDNRYQCLW